MFFSLSNIYMYIYVNNTAVGHTLGKDTYRFRSCKPPAGGLTDICAKRGGGGVPKYFLIV